jgi:hypothetical protein
MRYGTGLQCLEKNVFQTTLYGTVELNEFNHGCIVPKELGVLKKKLLHYESYMSE